MSDFDELIKQFETTSYLCGCSDDSKYLQRKYKQDEARKALTDAISAVTSERDNLAGRVRELARIISDDGTPDEDLYQSLTEGLPEVAK